MEILETRLEERRITTLSRGNLVNLDQFLNHSAVNLLIFGYGFLTLGLRGDEKNQALFLKVKEILEE